MTSPMNVCILVPSILGGGAEDSMFQLADFFQSKDIRTKLIGINSSPEPISSNHDSISLGRKDNNGLIETFRVFFRLRKLVDAFNPDVLIVNCEVSELYAAFLSSTRLIVVEHTTRPWIGRKLIGLLVRSILSLKRATWITVNRNQKAIWPFRVRCFHIPNPVRYYPAVIGNQSRIVFVGRMIASKRPELIVRLARETNEKAVFIGDGILMDRLKNLAAGERIEFKGFQVNPWKEISSDELLIVPSEFEGDGKTIVEAILRGNPLLLADNPDLRRFCLAEEHYFVNYVDLKAKTLRYFSEGPEVFRVPLTLRNKLSVDRSIEEVGPRWLQLLG